jgi:hypothetical protein
LRHPLCIFHYTCCVPTARRKTVKIIFYRHSVPNGTHNPAVVIGRRNDEAIRLFSVISGLLHFVRNDESWLSRRPLIIRQSYGRCTLTKTEARTKSYSIRAPNVFFPSKHFRITVIPVFSLWFPSVSCVELSGYRTYLPKY